MLSGEIKSFFSHQTYACPHTMYMCCDCQPVGILVYVYTSLFTCTGLLEKLGSFGSFNVVRLWCQCSGNKFKHKQLQCVLHTTTPAPNMRCNVCFPSVEPHLDGYFCSCQSTRQWMEEFIYYVCCVQLTQYAHVLVQCISHCVLNPHTHICAHVTYLVCYYSCSIRNDIHDHFFFFFTGSRGLCN